MNRVETAIAKAQERIDKAEPDAIRRAEKAGQATLQELVTYRQVVSLGQAAGAITLEEAALAQEILGGGSASVEKWKARSMAERWTVMMLVFELNCSLRLDTEPIRRRKR